MARSTKPVFSSTNATCRQVVPLLVVFQTPPLAAPTYRRFGFASSTATAVMRPPVQAGPIDRATKASSNLASNAGGGVADARLPSTRNGRQRTVKGTERYF